MLNENTTTMPAALRAAEMGFPVFPVNPANKMPLTPHGFYDGTRDSDAIKSFWNQFPTAMVGAATGHVSDFLVVDIDNKDGVDAFDKLRKLEGEVGELPQTMTVRTPSGGLHLYFKMPKDIDIRISAGLLGTGIDVRANGGYIVFPGSVREDGETYQLKDDNWTIADTPAGLIDACLRARKSRPANETINSVGGLLGEGRRNHDLTALAGFLRSRGAAQEQLEAALAAINEAVLSNPLGGDEVRRISASVSSYPYTVLRDQDTYTHGGFAKLLAKRLRGKASYCVGDGFYHHDGKRWVRDREGLKTLGVCRELIDEVIASIETLRNKCSSEDLFQLRKNGMKLKSVLFMKSSIEVAKADASLWVGLDEFDRNKDLLNLKNGTLNLRTGELHEHNPEDKLTHLLDFEYNPDAKAPVFSKFMEDILPDDKAQFLLRVFGYALTGTGNEQTFFVLHGKGKNGKSTFVEAMEGIFIKDQLSVNIQPESISGKMDGQIRNDLARLVGKRLLTTSETKTGSVLDAPLIKQITGGDSLTVRQLYQAPFQFKPTCVPVIITNHMPILDGSDYAMQRRACVISFDRRIEVADIALKEKIGEERSGIFNMLLQGLKDYRVHGLNPPASVVERTKKFVEGSNLIREFMQDRLDVVENGRLAASDLYSAYREWMEDNGYKPMSINSLKAAFERETGAEQSRDTEGRCWKGFHLKGRSYQLNPKFAEMFTG